MIEVHYLFVVGLLTCKEVNVHVTQYGPPSLGILVFQLLGVTRASDPAVPCGHRVSCCLTFSILIRKGMVSCARNIETAEYVFASGVQSLARIWYGMVWCGMVWYGMVWYGMVGQIR